MIRGLGRSGIGVLIALALVIANFAIALPLTGLSYGRFEWTAFNVSYEVTPTPTTTPTPTPTTTPTSTPVANGGSCMAGPQCASTFCVDDVCCDRACDQPGERCNLAGSRGVCSVPIAGAPLLSDGWIAVQILALLVIGGLSVLARRTRRRDAV